MRFDGICLLALLICLGSAAANDEPLPGSMQMAQGAFSEEFLKSLFGIGTEMGTDADRFWFGPEFNDVRTATSFFSEFYMESSTTTVTGGFVPVKIDIAEIQPSRVFFGSGQELPYSQYQSVVSSSRGNELWIQKGQDWSQYAIVPEGSAIQLTAFTPSGGEADHYKLLQTDSLNITSDRTNIYAGYNSLGFRAEKAGRYILLFVLNNQPSNAIVIDVISPPPASQQTAVAGDMPPSTNPPAGSTVQTGQRAQTAQMAQTTPMVQTAQAYPGIGSTLSGSPAAGSTVQAGASMQQTASSSSAAQYQSAAAFTQPRPAGTAYPSQAGMPRATATAVAAGDTPVTIQTPMRGYDVYVDGVMIGKDGSNGDILDGVFKFSVMGGQTHTIRIFDGENNYEKPMYFERGVSKIINVPPGTTVYSTAIPY